jgi:hypothetical protein
MDGQPFRFCVFGRAPKWLTVFLGTLFVIVTVLYLVTPESPKWLVVLMIVALAPVLFLSDRASREWFEISADGRRLTVIPAWYERRFWGKRTSIYEMPEGSSLLVCSCTNYGFSGGITVILRVPFGAETIVYEPQQGLPRKTWEEFQRELLVRWNIPVLFVSRILTEQGTEEKNEWIKEERKLDSRQVVAMILWILFPFSGALIRWVTPNPLPIILTGIILWFALVLYWRNLTRKLLHEKADAYMKQNLAVIAFQYAIFYGLAVLITDSILRK